MENVLLNNLYSTVKNVSGKQMTFGFLPPHGVTLANNATFTVFGDIREAISSGRRSAARRNLIAFANAIEDGKLQITSTPPPIFTNPTNGLVRTLQVTGVGHTVGAAVPSWTVSDSDNAPIPA